MQDTQVEERVENEEKEVRAQEPTLKSHFDNAEYERWSQNLRNKARSKGK
jgi:hypothetical protein